METPLTFWASIGIARSPAELYDMVADVTRMGEWSPVCKACWWDDRAGPQVGAWFTGRNEAARAGIPKTLAALKRAAEAA